MYRNKKNSFSNKRSNKSLQVENLEARQLMAADLAFDGEAILYQVHGNTGSQGQLSTIDVATGEFSDVGDNAGYKINAAGYRVADHFIYAVRPQDQELVKIDAEGDVDNLGKIEGLPKRSYYSGDFGSDGYLYLWSPQELYAVDVDTQEVVNTVSLSRKMASTPDIAYDPLTGLMYGVERVGKTSNFVSIDHDTGAVTTINDRF